MAGMDGITAGSVLRGNDENDLVQLIYVSSHEEYHLQLFDVQPSGFIKKPIDPELFQQKIIATAKRKRNHYPLSRYYLYGEQQAEGHSSYQR